jgi:hypothetical protein
MCQRWRAATGGIDAPMRLWLMVQRPTFTMLAVSGKGEIQPNRRGDQFRETDMKAILSNKKGNIIHKDTPLHAYSVFPCAKKRAPS